MIGRIILILISTVPVNVTYNLQEDYYLLYISGGKISSCILSNTCLGLGVKVIARLEVREEGLQWDNASDRLSSDDDFHMGYVFMMLILDAIVYYVIAW